MRTVWKYQLEMGRNEIEMPAFAVPRFAALDPTGEPCVWAEVDTDRITPVVERVITIYSTGHEVASQARYMASFVAGPYEWHVYEETRQNSHVLLSKRERALLRALLVTEVEDMRESESPGHSHQAGITHIEGLINRLGDDEPTERGVS